MNYYLFYAVDLYDKTKITKEKVNCPKMNANKWYTYFIPIQIIFSMFVACSSDHAGQYENYINQAIKYENEKKYEKAITSINLSLKIDSTKSFPYVLRGKILSVMHSDGAAILDFSKAIQVNPKNISAYFNKAISLSLLDNDDSAIFYFNQAIKMKEFGDFILEKKNSNFPDLESQNDISLSSIRFHRGLSMYSKKNDSLAIEDFKYSLKYGYNKSESQFYIGVILLQTGDNKNGCLYLKDALQNGNKDAYEYLRKFCN